jgi:hypothetical protein
MQALHAALDGIDSGVQPSDVAARGVGQSGRCAHAFDVLQDLLQRLGRKRHKLRPAQRRRALDDRDHVLKTHRAHIALRLRHDQVGRERREQFGIDFVERQPGRKPLAHLLVDRAARLLRIDQRPRHARAVRRLRRPVALMPNPHHPLACADGKQHLGRAREQRHNASWSIRHNGNPWRRNLISCLSGLLPRNRRSAHFASPHPEGHSCPFDILGPPFMAGRRLPRAARPAVNGGSKRAEGA